MRGTASAVALPLSVSCSPRLTGGVTVIGYKVKCYPLTSAQEGSFEVSMGRHVYVRQGCGRLGGEALPIVALSVYFASNSGRTVALKTGVVGRDVTTLCRVLVSRATARRECSLPCGLIGVVTRRRFSTVTSSGVGLVAVYCVSLFDLSPTRILVGRLTCTGRGPGLSTVRLFRRFVGRTGVGVGNGSVSIYSFFSALVSTFGRIFSGDIRMRVSCVKRILRQVHPTGNFIPVLALVASCRPLSGRQVGALVSFLKVPCDCASGKSFGPPPSSLASSDGLSSSVLTLVKRGTLFACLAKLRGYNCIYPLRSFYRGRGYSGRRYCSRP